MKIILTLSVISYFHKIIYQMKHIYKVSMANKKVSEVCHNPGFAKIICWLFKEQELSVEFAHNIDGIIKNVYHPIKDR